MKLEEKLALLRKEKGLTQLELAEELDVSRQAVSRWETGAAVPATENLSCLSRLYQVPVDYLLNEDEDTEKAEREKEEDRPVPVHGGKKRTALVLAAAALVLLALVLGLWAGYLLGKASQNGEIHLSIEKMKGEEVDLSSAGTFTIETGW